MDLGTVGSPGVNSSGYQGTTVLAILMNVDSLLEDN